MSIAQRTCSIEGCERPQYERDWCSKHWQTWKTYGDPGYRPPTLEERFWAKVAKGGSDECWEWTAGRTPKGYGRFRRTSTEHTKFAHRVAYELTIGLIPAALRVLHRCDNPPCVNPAHLFVGTLADNNADRHAKGRGATGERHGMAKLTAGDVAAIRAAIGTQEALAAQYGVDRSTISHIRTNRKWRCEL